MHCQHYHCPKLIELSNVDLILNHATAADVDIEFLNYVSSDTGVSCCSIIEIGIKLQRMDIVKSLVNKGANAICAGGDPSKYPGLVQLFGEYYEFGTNRYITWLLHEYINEKDIPRFIDDVMKVDICGDKSMEMFNRVGRHAAHAVLTSGHMRLCEKFVEKHGKAVLTVKDPNERTALLVAASHGDDESVKTILEL